MTFDLLIDSLSKRISWSVARKILHHHHIQCGRNWEGTKEKLLAVTNQDDKKSLKIKLKKIYLNHLRTGDRSIHLFREKKQIIEQIIDCFDNHPIPDSHFKENYPYLLDESALNNEEDDTFLVKVIKEEEGRLLVFCSKRFLRERVDIPPEGTLSEYSEIIGIKTHQKQSFDIVVLDPLSELIEIRVDAGSKVPSDDRKTAFNQIKSVFQKLVTDLTSNRFILNEPVNLFPIIGKLYKSEEGRVCELAFTTDDTSSNKHEKMRRRHENLRHEAYHQGGSIAVEGKISPYRIAVTWAYDSLNTEPELLLAGSARMLSSETPILNEAIIVDCAGIEDYGFVMQKLNSLLET